MAVMEDITKVVNDFLKKMLSPRDLKVVRIARVGEGWEADAEVYEESSFIKALGLPTKVQDKNFYSVTLDEKMEVECYERKTSMGSV